MKRLNSTAYRLPFSFRYSPGPLWGEGVCTTVRVNLRPGHDVKAWQASLHMKMMNFGVLCGTGALGVVPKDDFDPMSALFDTVRIQDDRLEWMLDEWPATNDSLPVLASLHAAGDVVEAIAGLSVTARGEPATIGLAYESRPLRCYPPQSLDAPFPWTIDNDGQEDIRLQLRLAREPGAEERRAIEQTFLLWANAASAGAYGVAPVEPLKCALLFDEEVEQYGERIVWHLRRFRAHPDALEGLVAVCHAIHCRVSPVAECLID